MSVLSIIVVAFSCKFFVIGLTFILKIVYSYAIHILEFLL